MTWNTRSSPCTTSTVSPGADVSAPPVVVASVPSVASVASVASVPPAAVVPAAASVADESSSSSPVQATKISDSAAVAITARRSVVLMDWSPCGARWLSTRSMRFPRPTWLVAWVPRTGGTRRSWRRRERGLAVGRLLAGDGHILLEHVQAVVALALEGDDDVGDGYVAVAERCEQPRLHGGHEPELAVGQPGRDVRAHVLQVHERDAFGVADREVERIGAAERHVARVEADRHVRRSRGTARARRRSR